jgi:hypothetical protein
MHFSSLHMPSKFYSFLQSSVSSSVLDPSDLLSILFLNTLNLYSSFKVRHKLPYVKQGTAFSGGTHMFHLKPCTYFENFQTSSCKTVIRTKILNRPAVPHCVGIPHFKVMYLKIFIKSCCVFCSK